MGDMKAPEKWRGSNVMIDTWDWLLIRWVWISAGLKCTRWQRLYLGYFGDISGKLEEVHLPSLHTVWSEHLKQHNIFRSTENVELGNHYRILLSVQFQAYTGICCQSTCILCSLNTSLEPQYVHHLSKSLFVTKYWDELSPFRYHLYAFHSRQYRSSLSGKVWLLESVALIGYLSSVY